MTLAAREFMEHAPAAAPVACAHCSLPVPAGLQEAGAPQQFCCQGCKTVYAVIHSCHMDQYYDYLQRDRVNGGTGATPARVTGKAYREFDDPAFLELHAPLAPNHTRSIDFYLEGVHCAACVWLVEKLPALLPGVIESRLDLGKQLVRITWLDTPSQDRIENQKSKIENLSRIARTLDSLGYAPHPARSSSARQVRTRDDRRQLIRIGVAGACAGNTMLLAVALYAGLFAAMEPGYVLFFRWLSMLIGITALAWPGSVFFKGALAALRTRTPHLDLPVALALAAGGIVGVVNTLRNSGEIYFDSLSVLVFLLLVGRFLQHRQQGLADDAVELLFSLTPMSAHKLLEDGTLADVPIASLQLHDTVQVQPGESLPVDGTLVDWTPHDSQSKIKNQKSKIPLTTIDESLLTGESLPRSLQSGDAVHAGTTNLSSPIRVQVLATGESTRVGKLMRLVTECARRKAPMVLFADRIAGRFLIAVLAIALAVFAVWFLRGTHSAAVDHAVAILIVACPCALGLATPLAVTVAIGRAARRGILIKGGDTLERLAKPGLLFLDKTGTLTTGQVSVQHWECLAIDEEEIRGAVAAIEAHATHPVARALAAFAQGAPDGNPGFSSAFPVDASRAENISQDMAGGITATVGGHTYAIGSQSFIQQSIPSLQIENRKSKIKNLLTLALSPVFIARDGILVAVAGVGDSLRPDAAASLAALRSQGWQLAILSGDHPAIVRRIAEQLAIDPAHAHGGLLPEQKLAHIRSHIAPFPNQESKIKNQKSPTVVMVGDGVNDAAALAAAHVGIAVHGGAEASLAAAGIYLNQPGLAPILDVMTAARRTVSTIHRSLAASLLYNALAVTLAALGFISPLLAAILMPISSLTVLSLAFGTRTFRVDLSNSSLSSPLPEGALT